MRFIEEITDYGDTPEVYVSGVSSICQISPGTIRLTFYCAHERDDGTTENRVISSQIWDMSIWIEAGSNFRAGRESLQREAESFRSKERHMRAGAH